MPVPLGIVAAVNAEAPPFTPAAIPNVIGWWDASNAGSIHATGDEVDTWDNLIVAGSPLPNLHQATGANRPHTGNNTLNGLNVLNMSSEFFQPASALVLSQPFTLYVLANVVTDTEQRFLSTFSNDFDHRREGTFANDKPSVYTGSPGFEGNNASWLINTWYWVRWADNGASSSILIKGSTNVTGNSGGGGCNTTSIVVGGGADGPVLLAEMVIIANALDSGVETDLLAYWLAKWNV
jgi:hypothetical protein